MFSPKEATPLRLVAAGLSDLGQVRKRNEDCWFIAPSSPLLFIVSDGMGGQQGGDVASNAVITVLPPLIKQRFSQMPDRSDKSISEMLGQSISELSRNLRSGSKEHVGLKGMGATVALMLCYKGVAHLAHMGDSRIYLCRNKQLTLLTEDHSVITMLRKHGEIKPEEDISHHPARGRLSRYVGMEDDAFPDLKTKPLKVGDRLLLCSDGLTGMVPPADIEKLLQIHTDSSTACQALINAANAAGGKDNITAIVVDCLPKATKEQPKEQKRITNPLNSKQFQGPPRS